MHNLFTEYETVTRPDYYGKPYQVQRPKQRLDLGQLWEKFKQQDRYGETHNTGDQKAMETHFELQLKKDEY